MRSINGSQLAKKCEDYLCETFAGQAVCISSINYGGYYGLGVVVEGRVGYWPVPQAAYSTQNPAAAREEARRLNTSIWDIDAEEVSRLMAGAKVPEL